MCVGLPSAFLPLVGLQGPGSSGPKSPGVSRVPAFVLSAGASVSESHHQAQRKRDVACGGKSWRGLCARSCMFLVSCGRILLKASLVTGMGDELSLIFKSGRQQEEVAAQVVCKHVALSGALSGAVRGQDGEFSVYLPACGQTGNHIFRRKDHSLLQKAYGCLT